ncbi:MAG: KH domain-containing protein [Candidatus Levybacteria bacterium]|nr:KH domain-containing protein [Candidatus Levybacteria bacterium]MBP9815134.1 KH domain-containing protein [Candidatus Levybacteria bacterium]
MEENIKIITEKIEELMDLMDIEAEVLVSERDEALVVGIDAKDNNALLIGKHGNTLSALEYVIYILVAKDLPEGKRILIEIGGYREEREAYLADLATRLKEEVLETGVEKSVRGLKPWERRHVHMALAEDTEVMTESTGDDRDRVLIIKKK